MNVVWVVYPMMLKSELLRICGNCKHADKRLDFHEIQKPKKEAYLFLARRHASSLKDAKTLCQKEHISVSVMDEACAFWKQHS